MENIRPWAEIKSEFDSLQSYSEKLKWWELNVERPRFSDANSGIPYYLYYTQADAPKVKVFAAIIASQFDSVFSQVGESNQSETISILPRNSEIAEKTLFWNWILEKKNCWGLIEWERHYFDILEDTAKSNRDKVIRDLKNAIESEITEYKNNPYFNNGLNVAIYKNVDYCFFCEDGLQLIQPSKVVAWTVLGYINNLKEQALKNAEYRLNNPNDEIQPNRNMIRLKWNGPMNVLYDIFAQCLVNTKNGKPYLDNTQDVLADFIIQSFEGINAQKSTISKQIGMYKTGENNPPLSQRRIKLIEPEGDS